MIIAIIALVCACSGSAIAGSALVSGAQIRDNTVTGRDVRTASVHRSDLAPDATVLQTVTREAHALGAGPVTASCAQGEAVVGGGGNAPQMWKSQPHAAPGGAGESDGWTVQGKLPATQPTGATTGTGPIATVDYVTTAYVICAR